MRGCFVGEFALLAVNMTWVVALIHFEFMLGRFIDL